MRSTAWRFFCSTAKHPTMGYRPVTLDVKGDKAEAIKVARDAGWKPCTEAMGSSRRSLLNWWCPECVSSYAHRS